MSNSNESQTSPRNELSTEPHANINTTQVLVIEDNPDNMKLFEWVLEDLAYDFIGCETGEKGLAWLATNQPDLLLLDISLPGIDGKEVARRIRAQQTFDQLPIIAVTAHAIKSEINDIMSSGINIIVTKPIDEEHLAEVMHTLLDEAKQANDYISSANPC